MTATRDPETGKFVASDEQATTPAPEDEQDNTQVGDVVTFTRTDPCFGTSYTARGVVESIDETGVLVRPLEAYAVLIDDVTAAE